MLTVWVPSEGRTNLTGVHGALAALLYLVLGDLHGLWHLAHSSNAIQARPNAQCRPKLNVPYCVCRVNGFTAFVLFPSAA